MSTYVLNSDGIQSMIDGNLMPCLPEILALLISVTFIGVGRLPENWLGQMFHVCQHAMANALHWLKENNPDYYVHVEIDVEQLNRLPDGTVPTEILATV
jgi:hypothetical protein